MVTGFYWLAIFLAANLGLFMPSLQNSKKSQKLAFLEGKIIDRAGNYIKGGVVTISNAELGVNRQVETDDQGAYRFTELPPGTYKVRIEAQGFEPTEWTFSLNELGVGGYVTQLKGGGVDYKTDEKAEQEFIKNKKFSVGSLKKDIKKNLPMGSSPAQVSEFLKQRGIEPSELQISDSESDYPGERNLKLIRAALRNVKKSLWGYWGIFMSFRFDESNRLIGYKVKWVDMA